MQQRVPGSTHVSMPGSKHVSGAACGEESKNRPTRSMTRLQALPTSTIWNQHRSWRLHWCALFCLLCLQMGLWSSIALDASGNTQGQLLSCSGSCSMHHKCYAMPIAYITCNLASIPSQPALSWHGADAEVSQLLPRGPHLNGMRCACCSATHSRVMVDMLNSRCTHQQLSRASMPARMARTLQHHSTAAHSAQHTSHHISAC
jgi:hypothetical protein